MAQNDAGIQLEADNGAFEALTPYFGAMCCEAASYCFEQNGHAVPTQAALSGCETPHAHFHWTPPPAQAVATYRDKDVAAENGAYAVAIAVLNHIHGYKVIERSAKGTGFDFWVGATEGDLPFQNKVRLEVSGIFDGQSRVNSRLRSKLNQMAPSDGSGSGFAVVAEFGRPTVAVAKRKST
ncbi:hypothetical protein PTKU64_27390 [Paraburkholderia terrae]|uniref:Uncharacterized protein n=1 Tax=Paraburkholderia terrae TaxID=311230 RepID=A0ABM7TLE5_9BURK|nr:hypothetical protein [Paraburkholderia terrae]BCZ79064.1 hypothetical protein PTKU64_27390 [Paraburkholderia terrae]